MAGLLRTWVLAAALTTGPLTSWAQDEVSPAGIQAILAPPLTPAPQGDQQDASKSRVTVVEYFDYQCPVCRTMEPELAKLLASDPHVRVVRKDWPVFGALSVYAAYCVLAAEHFGAYEAAHRALMTAHGRFESREQIEGVLRDAGLDVAAIQAYIASQHMQLSAVLTRNHAEAEALGLKGTPGVVIGDQLVSGGLQLPELQRLVRQARSAHR